MNLKTKIAIIIPVYNETNEIVNKFINEINKVGNFVICVIDDGSQYALKINKKYKNVILLRHIINRGKGAAIITGIEYLSKFISKDIDVVITMDGDGQHNPSDILAMIKALNRDIDVVLGVRRNNYNIMPFYKKVANFLGDLIIFVFFGIYTRDSQSGMRVYKLNVLEKMNLTTDDYAFDSEVIKEIGRLKLKFEEVPIDVRYTEYSMNKKTKQTLIGGVRMIIKFFRLM